MQSRLIKGLLAAYLICAAGCCVAFGGLAGWGWPIARRLNAASASLFDCQYRDKNGYWHSNAACLQSSVLAITGEVKATGAAVTKAVPKIAESVSSMASSSAVSAQKSNETFDNVNGVIAKVGPVLDSTNELVQQLKTDAATLNGVVTELGTTVVALRSSSDTTIKAAGDSLTALSALEAAFQDALDKHLVHEIDGIGNKMLEVMSDPNITKTIANVQVATAHGAEIVTSIDTATRYLREKIGWVKWLVSRILGAVKIVFDPRH